MNVRFEESELSEQSLKEPTGDEVRSQLERMLQSRTFCHKPVVSKLLRYLVDNGLRGRVVKENTILSEFMQRKFVEGDTIVRTSVIHVRQAVNLYNADSDDPVIITVAERGYRVFFSYNSQNEMERLYQRAKRFFEQSR